MIRNQLFRLYAINNLRLRGIIRSIVTAMDGGSFRSVTLRRIFEHYHHVSIGMYTHAGCFVPFQFDRHTTIGRYCSVAMTVRIMNRNHALDYKSTHAMFTMASFGFVEKDLIDYVPLEIGHDVWIGHNALVMPSVRSIGTGAVIAAGAVVNKDVPPYAVVVGNPARVVRYRFPPETIERLLASEWWKSDISELKPLLHTFQQLYENHPTFYR